MRGPDGETRREEFAFFNSQGLKNFLFFLQGGIDIWFVLYYN